MTATREMLEGEAYWGRIRTIKRNLYILEAVLVIAMGVVLIGTSEEFSMNPFLIPFDRLLWFVLIIVLVVELEGFIFRFMQIQIARSDSVKYIMATNSIKRGVIVAIIAAIIAMALLLPGAAQGLEGALSYHGTATPGDPSRFQNKDPLGLSSVTSVSIHCSAPANICLVSQFIHDTYPGDSVREHALNKQLLASPDMEIDLSAFGYSTYYLFVWSENSSENANLTVAFTLNTKLSDSVTSLLPIVAIITVVANAVWVEYLFPLRKACACKSIYK